MTKDKALRRALEALEGMYIPNFTMDDSPINNAITAIKQTLEQPEPEPVAWMYVNKSTHETFFQRTMRSFVDHGNWSEVPLYGEPLANHELQCVCGAVWCGDEMVHLPNKTSSLKREPEPIECMCGICKLGKREWQGLTDEEIYKASTQAGMQEHYMGFHSGFIRFARAIEAKLKEKNDVS